MKARTVCGVLTTALVAIWLYLCPPAFLPCAFTGQTNGPPKVFTINARQALTLKELCDAIGVWHQRRPLSIEEGANLSLDRLTDLRALVFISDYNVARYACGLSQEMLDGANSAQFAPHDQLVLACAKDVVDAGVCSRLPAAPAYPNVV